MSIKKRKDSGWVICALVMMAVLLFSYFYAYTGAEFTLKYDQPHQIAGYEASKAHVKVEAGRSLAGDLVHPFWEVGGWFWWLLIGVGAWYVGTGRYIPRKWTDDPKSGEWKKYASYITPLVLCAVFWFADYSSKLDMKAYNGDYDEFVVKFKVDDATAKEIREEGGTGAYQYKDQNGLLKAWFKEQRSK